MRSRGSSRFIRISGPRRRRGWRWRCVVICRAGWRVIGPRSRRGRESCYEVSCVGRCDAGRRSAMRGSEALCRTGGDARGGAGVAERPLRRRGASITGCSIAPCEVIRCRCSTTSGTPKGDGRGGVPDGEEVGDGARSGGSGQVRDLQCRRGRAGHVQGSSDPGRAAAPGDRGDADRRCAWWARSRGGCSSATSTSPRSGCCVRRSTRCRGGGAGRVWERAMSRRRRVRLPGGYILGEETALLECMEGHRGEPRNKPPFPGGYGLHGRPTLMNNVETFAAVPVILQRGAQWWKEQGVNGGRPGLKFFSISGHVEQPGVFCVPAGTRVPRGDRRWPAGCATAPGWVRCSPAARRRTSSAPTARSAAGLRRGRRGRHRRSAPARWSSWPRAPTCSRPTTNVLQLLSQRVLRQMRALPRRLAQGPADPAPTCSTRRQRQRRRPAHRRARGDDAPDLHLRTRTSRARPRHVRPATRGRAARSPGEGGDGDQGRGARRGGDRRVRGRGPGARRDRGAPDRPRRASRGAAHERGARAVGARRLRRAPAGDGRPERDRARRLRLPRAQGELVRELRAAARAAAARRDGGRGRPERDPLVVLPRHSTGSTGDAASKPSIPAAPSHA